MMDSKEKIKNLFREGMKKSTARNVAGLVMGISLLVILVAVIPLLPAFSYHILSGKKMDHNLLDVITLRNWIGGLLLVIFFSILNRRNEESNSEGRDS